MFTSEGPDEEIFLREGVGVCEVQVEGTECAWKSMCAWGVYLKLCVTVLGHLCVFEYVHEALHKELFFNLTFRTSHVLAHSVFTVTL